MHVDCALLSLTVFPPLQVRHFLSHPSNSDRVMYNHGVPHSLSIIHPSLVPSLLSLPSPSPCPARWFAFVCVCLHRLLPFLHFPELFTVIHRLKNLSVPLPSLHFYFPSEMHIPSLLSIDPPKNPFSSFARLIPRCFSLNPSMSSLSSKCLCTAAAN